MTSSVRRAKLGYSCDAWSSVNDLLLRVMVLKLEGNFDAIDYHGRMAVQESGISS